MPPEAVARLAAYRNIWWPMANECDPMPAKFVTDWDRFLRIVQESAPFNTFTQFTTATSSPTMPTTSHEYSNTAIALTDTDQSQ
jgi:hypothetical protein